MRSIVKKRYTHSYIARLLEIELSSYKKYRKNNVTFVFLTNLILFGMIDFDDSNRLIALIREAVKKENSALHTFHSINIILQLGEVPQEIMQIAQKYLGVFPLEEYPDLYINKNELSQP